MSGMDFLTSEDSTPIATGVGPALGADMLL